MGQRRSGIKEGMTHRGDDLVEVALGRERLKDVALGLLAAICIAGIVWLNRNFETAN